MIEYMIIGHFLKYRQQLQLTNFVKIYHYAF